VTWPSPLWGTGARPPARHGRDDRLIGIREFRALFGLGRTAVYQRSHMPDDVFGGGQGPGRIPPMVPRQGGGRT
jgi:hypothetical protein